MTAAIEQLDVIEAHFLEPLQEMRAGCVYALVTTLPPFDEGVSLATLVSFGQDEFPGASTETSVLGQPPMVSWWSRCAWRSTCSEL